MILAITTKVVFSERVAWVGKAGQKSNGWFIAPYPRMWCTLTWPGRNSNCVAYMWGCN